eukprot:1144247-Pelagomonas_calceolata.AAC.5
MSKRLHILLAHYSTHNRLCYANVVQTHSGKPTKIFKLMSGPVGACPTFSQDSRLLLHGPWDLNKK